MAPPSKKPLVRAALPGGIRQLVKRTGLAQSTIRRWLREMRKDGEAHISGWKRTAGQLTPIWVAGKGNDAPEPKPLPGAIYCRRWRRREKKDNAEFMEAKQRAREAAERAKATPQTWLSALIIPK